MNSFTKFLVSAAVVLGMAVTALAEDVVTLKNGREYRGTILEQNDGIIRMRVDFGGIEKTITIWSDDVDSIQEDAEAPVKTEPVKGITPVAKAEAPAKGENQQSEQDLVNKRVYVIPMHGGVGQTFRMDKLKEAVDAGRPFNPDVIILEIDSPGGSLNEVYKLRDYLQEIRNEFRIVVWIKSAISAAAMTSLNVREMYFMKEGHMGAATAWYNDGSGAKSVQGEELKKILDQFRDFVESAGYHPYIAQAMVDPTYALSADVEEMPNGDRRVTWYDSEDGGEFLLCKEGEILTMTASQAEFFNISLGTVDDKQEFARLLNLSGWVEVSDAGRKIMEQWKHAYEQAEIELPRLYREYANGASTNDDRIRVVRELLKWVRRYPAIVEFYAMPDGSGQQLTERSLERLLRRLVRG